MRAGEVVGPYELVEQAPLEFIRFPRTRQVGSRLITGSWSEPWWAYCPERGWVIVRRWKNKPFEADRWSPAVPALNCLVLNALGPDNTLGPELEPEAFLHVG